MDEEVVAEVPIHFAISRIAFSPTSAFVGYEKRENQNVRDFEPPRKRMMFTNKITNRVQISIGAGLLTCILLLSACIQPLDNHRFHPESPLPKPLLIVKHPKPDLPLIDSRPFSDTLRIADPVADAANKKYGLDAQSIGTCYPIDFSQPNWTIERENCPWTLAATQTECDSISSPNPLWGGLEPSYPIARCAILHWSLRNITNREFFYASDGGMLRPSYRYVVYKEGGLQEIHTIAELQALYAPITSANEALSYAMVATGLEADFRDKLEEDLERYHFYVLKLENTYVKPTNDGYQVLLYHSSWPCEMATTTTEVVTVMKDGRIVRGTAQTAYDFFIGGCAD